jgi:hypothetical protein
MLSTIQVVLLDDDELKKKLWELHVHIAVESS